MSDTPAGTPAPARWADALAAAQLFALDPHGLGGICVRAPAGPVRERWQSCLKDALAPQTASRRLPLHATEARLLGGLDLAATLNAGKPVAEKGILTQTDMGVLTVAMAERIAPATTAHLAQALDRGVISIAREGFTASVPARIGVVALDEGIADDERAPAALLDRLAFHLDLTDIGLRDADDMPCDAEALGAARALLPAVDVGAPLIEALCATAQALGIDSARATLLAVHAARCTAALDGRTAADENDAVLAGRLVLAPRATRLPPPAQEPPPDEPESEAPPEPPAQESKPEPLQDQDEEQDPPPPDERMLEDLLLAAATAAMPRGLLAQLKSAENRARRAHGGGRAGAVQKEAKRGRPTGIRAGDTRRGDRLNIIETLRAAAPWQRLRQRESAGDARGASRPRVSVRAQDFRVTRYKQKSETATIFVVDASGSSALNRLAEAKGAVELLLADCYVRRDRVALISFRGRSAELLLPPTRSLVRAKRSLGGLPGGGGTPLAAGIDAAAGLADAVRRHGETPSVVFLTDGRANISRDGTPGREVAEADALSAARALRAAGIATLLVDTSPRSQPQAQNLAQAMNATYLALPHADARGLSAAVRAALPAPAN